MYICIIVLYNNNNHIMRKPAPGGHSVALHSSTVKLSDCNRYLASSFSLL